MKKAKLPEKRDVISDKFGCHHEVLSVCYDEGLVYFYCHEEGLDASLLFSDIVSLYKPVEWGEE